MEKDLQEVINFFDYYRKTLTDRLFTFPEHYGIKQSFYMEVIFGIRTILVFLKNKSLFKKEQDMLRVKIEDLKTSLASWLHIFSDKTLDEFFKEFESLPIAEKLTASWEKMTGETVDKRKVVLDQGSGRIYFMLPEAPVQDGFMVLAPNFVGSPIYIPAIKAVAYKGCDDCLSFRRHGIWDADSAEESIHHLKSILATGKLP